MTRADCYPPLCTDSNWSLAAFVRCFPAAGVSLLGHLLSQFELLFASKGGTAAESMRHGGRVLLDQYVQVLSRCGDCSVTVLLLCCWQLRWALTLLLSLCSHCYCLQRHCALTGTVCSLRVTSKSRMC